MAQSDLSKARNSKNDEFYTQYMDVEKEMTAYLEFDPNVFKGKTVLLPCDDPEWSNFTKFFAQNFQRFGLKKLISTSFAAESKNFKSVYQPTLFELNDPQFDEKKTRVKGKIFTLTKDKSGDGKVDVNDLEWTYLKGDGDFRSDEIVKLRDESDIIVTNPPFSLFREFLAWIVEANKKFVIIGNMNAITYKEVFPLIRNNKLWTGNRFNQRLNGKNMTFYVPDDYKLSGTEVEVDSQGKKMISVAGTGWYTNLEHGRRHQPLVLMTMEDNIKFSKHKEIRGKEYKKYDNYDAIEVPFTDAIPSDYDGVMGVPISFLTKYNPEQFEIIWQASGNTRASAPKEILKLLKYFPHPEDRGGCTVIEGKRTYGRILIKRLK
jgi:hypothetical protein